VMEKVLASLDDPDDAAVFEVLPGRSVVQTVDFMPALVSDPYQFARITALHCLSDIFAMGAEPQGVLVLVLIPFGRDEVVEEQLYQLLSGVISVLRECDSVLLGGHTAEGDQLALGITCNGVIRPDQLLRKEGMRPGEKIILTKPLGTGTLFAADMRLEASGHWVDEVLESMSLSNQGASQVLRANGAVSCTDVTGFGLVGHLLEMLKPASVSAALDLEAIPVYGGARKTVEKGIFSSLQPQNQVASEWISNPETAVDHPTYPLLFDPQTSGGLLASVPADRAEHCLAELKAARYESSSIIGEVVAKGDRVTVDLRS
ncbi:MAG: selenide, water dikinase SelD, partial [Verrucomicrobiota bacterium]